MIFIYKSDNHDDLNLTFKKIEQKMQVMCNDDDHCLLRFSIKNFDEEKGVGNHTLYGFCTTTLRLIIDNPGKEFPLYYRNGKPTSGHIKFTKSMIVEQPSFGEFLKSGWHINLSVAIDYTASNGDPKTDPNSLHRLPLNIQPDQAINEYEEAMLQVGTILETYAFGKRFMAYGFGGKPEGCEEVSHCFPLNGNNDDPSVKGLQELLKTYKDSLTRIQLWGPTFFVNVHKRVFEFIKEKMHKNIYHVLLILTDGCIHDMRQTIDVIVEASEYPLSIIIVGIGDSDFENMAVLDADDYDLVDSFGKKAARDIV